MKNQDVNNISGSATVNQAQGDIHVHGMDAVQVYHLCRSVVSAELESYKEQAATLAVQRFDDCMKKFDERLQKLEVEVRERLREPSVQYALHTGLIECVKTSKEEKQEEILDLLIDRLKFDDNESERNMLDSVIKTIPQLTKKQVSILVVKQIFDYSYSLIYPKESDNVNKIIYDNIFLVIKNDNFLCQYYEAFLQTNLSDFQYLYHVGCAINCIYSEVLSNCNENKLKEWDILHDPSALSALIHIEFIKSIKLSALGNHIANRIIIKSNYKPLYPII